MQPHCIRCRSGSESGSLDEAGYDGMEGRIRPSSEREARSENEPVD